MDQICDVLLKGFQAVPRSFRVSLTNMAVYVFPVLTLQFGSAPQSFRPIIDNECPSSECDIMLVEYLNSLPSKMNSGGISSPE